jgi:hypothetical protein
MLLRDLDKAHTSTDLAMHTQRMLLRDLGKAHTSTDLATHTLTHACVRAEARERGREGERDAGHAPHTSAYAPHTSAYAPHTSAYAPHTSAYAPHTSAYAPKTQEELKILYEQVSFYIIYL